MSSQKRQTRRKKKNLSHLEPLFQGVKETLVHDIGDEFVNRQYANKGRGEDVPPLNDGAPPYVFKRVQQLLHFDKRIIWETDTSFKDLSENSKNEFLESQEKFLCPEPLSRRASLVILKAYQECSRILGSFCYDEWFDSCSFGKRAAVKLPRTDCYLDTRFARISGTRKQVASFNHCLARDVHLFRAVRKFNQQREVVDAIKVTAVPKSWKAARIIAPDTILGGFLSRGLGDVVRKRLERNTLINLSKQQDRHRRWAQKASENGRYATIDMSKASDSFVWRHIEMLVPEDWHHALDIVRTPLCEVAGKLINPRSYMLMGSGHTFPLQTLLFYCLAESVRTLLKCRGKVSVYGDDIIVPTTMARHFNVVMSELGFTINSEKSFFDEPDPDRPSHTFFRESCGGDYKGGVDVRPYMPECDLQSDGRVSCNEFLAWCHKVINGLLERWSPEEIPQTLNFLLNEITKKKKKVCFVPKWEVDHSGIKHVLPSYLLVGHDTSTISWVNSMPSYYRLTLNRQKRKRKVNERPYIWYSYWLKQSPYASDDLYDVKVSLNGEPNRRRKGVYRWKQVGPKPIGRIKTAKGWRDL